MELIDNLTIRTYEAVLFLVPFTLIALLGLIFFDQKRFFALREYAKRAIIAYKENDLGELLRHNTQMRDSLAMIQFVRVLLGISAGVVVWILAGRSQFSIVFCTAFLLVYKSPYWILKWQNRKRLEQVNQAFPYCMKNLLFLSYIYPVDNALHKAARCAPQILRLPLFSLVEDIDRDPNSFTPYQTFLDSFGGPVNSLSLYLRAIYRISQSGGKKSEKLLDNLNSAISNELNLARTSKNKSVNDTIQYFGLIPVFLLSMMLTYLLVIASSLI